MSDPNKELGKWILINALNLPIGTLVTMKILKDLNIDSVKITKENDNFSLLNSVEASSFEKSKENNN